MWAESVFVGGRILSLDPRIPEAAGMAVVGGRIVSMGSAGDVFALVARDTRVFELKGMCVVPGFIDAHSHVMSWGLEMLHDDLAGARCIGDILSSLSQGPCKRSGTMDNCEEV